MIITDTQPHRIVTLVEGGPAHASGLVREGDVIISIDGKSVERCSLQEVRERLVGRTGTSVDLQLLRTSWTDPEPALIHARIKREAPGLVTSSPADKAGGEVQGGTGGPEW